MSGVRVLVTGGAGFVGSHLCEALLSRGHDVVCVDNLCTGRLDNVAHLVGRPGFTFLERDVTEPLPVSGPVGLVFALASAASPEHYHRMPIETLRAGALGTEHALDLAEVTGARFVLASTSEVYGDPDVHPQPESYWGKVNPVGPRSVYDEAKRFAEALTVAYRRTRGVDTGIARIFNTYGPRMRADDGRMVPTFIRQALARQPLTVTGSGDQTRSLCYVTDTVAGLLALGRSTETGPVNIGNPEERSVTEIADAIRAIVGAEVPIERIAAVIDDPRRRCPDITRAETALDWSPLIPLDEGLRRTIAYFAGAEPITRAVADPVG